MGVIVKLGEPRPDPSKSRKAAKSSLGKGLLPEGLSEQKGKLVLLGTVIVLAVGFILSQTAPQLFRGTASSVQEEVLPQPDEDELRPGEAVPTIQSNGEVGTSSPEVR